MTYGYMTYNSQHINQNFILFIKLNPNVTQILKQIKRKNIWKQN